MNTAFIMLEAAAGGSGWETIIMIVALFAIFYFLMIRPQQKKQKELQKQRDAITRGDRVVTAGGIYGTVRQTKENSFVIEVDKNVHLEVDRNSVYPREGGKADNRQQPSQEESPKTEA
ncbi:MAG: preprotein translocase subunit YajC [Clostridium sp.]|nr:preprotein translocase subunit YajC [Clostridium sp.]